MNKVQIAGRQWLNTPVIGVLIAFAVAVAIYLQNPALALLGTVVIRLTCNANPIAHSSKIGKWSLQGAIVLLGSTLGVERLISVSADYGLMVACYVLGTLGLGALLAWVFVQAKSAGPGAAASLGAAPNSVDARLNPELVLLTSGTAICGGTAIATLAPIIGARSQQFAVATALVFLLNIIAVFLFPWIGQWLNLSQEAFGAWVALAVHDTSSVVATATLYGDEAVAVATTIKLGRTLWLIPLAFVASILFKTSEARVRVPAFVLLFVLAAVLSTLIDIPTAVNQAIAVFSKTLLVLALAMIGLDISRETLRQVSLSSVLFGVGLWLIVAPLALLMVLYL